MKIINKIKNFFNKNFYKNEPMSFKDLCSKFEYEQSLIKQEKGLKLLNYIIEQDRYQIKELKDNIKWFKKTKRRLKRLIKSKPSEIYIYEPHDLEWGECHWVDIQIAVPNLFGKLTQYWVCTLQTYTMLKDDQKSAIKYGWEYPIISEYPYEWFDDMYFDIPYFKDEQTIINCFKEWVKIFLPELEDIKIVFKEIE